MLFIEVQNAEEGDAERGIIEQEFSSGYVKSVMPVSQPSRDVKWEVCWAKGRSKEEVYKQKISKLFSEQRVLNTNSTAEVSRFPVLYNLQLHANV